MNAAGQHFDLVSTQLQKLCAGLIADGVHPDDVSGPLMRESIAILIVADGPIATAKHLRDLARQIETGAEIGIN